MIASIGSPLSAKKSLDPLLAIPSKKDIHVFSRVASDGHIFVHGDASAKSDSQILLTSIIYKAAKDTEAAGYSRFAIVRQLKRVTYIYGNPLILVLELHAIPVKASDLAVSERNDVPVVYKDTASAIYDMKSMLKYRYPGQWSDDEASNTNQ